MYVPYVSHHVMIGQWENGYITLSVLSMALVKFPAMRGVFQGLSLTDHIRYLVDRSGRTKD